MSGYSPLIIDLLMAFSALQGRRVEAVGEDLGMRIDPFFLEVAIARNFVFTFPPFFLSHGIGPQAAERIRINRLLVGDRANHSRARGGRSA